MHNDAMGTEGREEGEPGQNFSYNPANSAQTHRMTEPPRLVPDATSPNRTIPQVSPRPTFYQQQPVPMNRAPIQYVMQNQQQHPFQQQISTQHLPMNQPTYLQNYYPQQPIVVHQQNPYNQQRKYSTASSIMVPFGQLAVSQQSPQFPHQQVMLMGPMVRPSSLPNQQLIPVQQYGLPETLQPMPPPTNRMQPQSVSPISNFTIPAPRLQPVGRSQFLPPFAPQATVNRHGSISSSYSTNTQPVLMMPSRELVGDNSHQASSVQRQSLVYAPPPAIALVPHVRRSPTRLFDSNNNSPLTVTPATANLDEIKFSGNIALLSHVSRAFKRYIPLGNHIKDGLEYQRCFSGKTAIDVLGSILKTKERNIALYYGRELESQHFFHDILWNTKLVDDENEFYEFDASVLHDQVSVRSYPSGVFTRTTKCYSPTCSKEGCYSYLCPRNILKRARNSVIGDSGKASPNKTMMNPEDELILNLTLTEAEKDLWSNTVSKEVIESCTQDEIIRQETLFELIKGEVKYVKELELIQELFTDPLKSSANIRIENKDEFISQCILNTTQILQVHKKLCAKLLLRQNEDHIIENIGDVFESFVDKFDIYVEYCRGEPMGQYRLSKEKEKNPELASFLEEIQRNPKALRLGIDHYLVRPRGRMGHYTTLLERIIKKTPEENPDKAVLSRIMTKIRDILAQCNSESGKMSNKIQIMEFENELDATPNQLRDLKLADPKRQFIRANMVTVKRPTGESFMYLVLFDHALIILTKKKNNKRKIHKDIMYLQLISIGEKSKSATESAPPVPPKDNGKEQKYPMTITYSGHERQVFQVLFPTEADRKSWREAIMRQTEKLQTELDTYYASVLCDFGSDQDLEINCSIAYMEYIFLGTDNGLYIAKEMNPDTRPRWTREFLRQVLDLTKITQIEIIVEMDMLLILSGKDRLITIHSLLSVLELWEANDLNASKLLKAEKLTSGITFFKAAQLGEKNIVCCVKAGSFLSSFKVFEVRFTSEEKKKGFGLFRGSSMNLTQKLQKYKEFYIPSEVSSLHFIKNRICVGSSKGFEVVDLDSLEPKSLLDAEDPALSFVNSKDSVKPISIFRLREGEFLICYDEFGFYVDKYGRLLESRPMVISWIGSPHAFSFDPPYLIVYDQSFFEIREADTGKLIQVIQAASIKILNMDQNILDCTVVNSDGSKHIVQLKRLK